MAPKKWLNIIIDGNSALGPYWPSIFSDCLEKIVRNFFEDSRNEGTNACEVGLVMYNATSIQGFEFQYIHWTREVNQFLALLSSLDFNGSNENQHSMVQGLGEALAMFPRPSSVMTTIEYYNGTRHCILIAPRDPIPWRMPVSVPEITQGRTIGTQLCTINADFYEVAELFGPLAVSLSIISPVQHPSFEVIFNMANNGSPLETIPISNIRIGHFNVILSRNFREAHVALFGNRTMDPPTNDITVPVHLADDNQEDLFTIASMMMNGGRIIEAAKNYRLETTNPVSLVAPNVSTSAVGISTPPMVASIAPTFTTREGYSQGLVQEQRGNVIAGSSETCSMDTTLGVGMTDPRGFPPAHNTTSIHSSGNSFNILPYLSSPVLPYIAATTSTSNITRPRLPYLAAGFDVYGRPVFEATGVPPAPIIPPFNPSDFWPPQSSTSNSFDLVLAWQGTLLGKTHRNRKNTQRGRAHRRVTSPSTLTSQWSSRLEIVFYLPQRSLNYTITIYRGPIDYVFFYMLHFNNLDLYEHLKDKNLCAKINLPFQTLILSPTRNRHYYIGTVFPKDVTFIQMN